MANPLNYNTDNEGDLIYDTNVKCNNVKIKDSAISICSLNMTVLSDSVKLKCVFEIDHDVMVLTDTSTSVDQIKQIKFFGANVSANMNFIQVILNIEAI